MPDFTIENELHAKGYAVVCGVDEAGRGPLCGPVVAAACILPPDARIPGLDDSKKLSEKKREQLFPIIQQTAVAYGIGMASPEEIDRLNILNADMLAMRRAIEALSVPADIAVVDGNVARDLPIPAVTVVKGDAKSLSVSAASILAKVTRDRIMREYDEMYPQYGFLKNKGYGTAQHIAALREYGPTPIHRRSFIKKFI